MDLFSPITSIGIIEDPTRCPPNFDVVLRSADRRDDGDLWTDGLFRNKVTRYLCFSRTPNKHKDAEQLLLTDICILNEKDPLPQGFSCIEMTLDTSEWKGGGEKALKKKMICVKYAERVGVGEAICDVILLSRAKRPPSLHTLVGEINHLMVCYKTCPVTASSLVASSLSPPPSLPSREEDSLQETIPPNYSNTGTLFINAMYGVPFHLNSSFFTDKNENLDHRELEKKYSDTTLDLTEEFEYSFILEHSLTQQAL